MKPKIYVAGPYTKGNVIQNIRRAIDAADFLLEWGFIPFVPHLTGFWDLISPHSYDTWMKYDSEWLKTCDAVWRLEGESDGADKEEVMALRIGIPVFYNSKDVIQHFKEKK